MTSELAVIHAVDRVVIEANWEMASCLIGMTNGLIDRSRTSPRDWQAESAGQELVIISALNGAFR